MRWPEVLPLISTTATDSLPRTDLTILVCLTLSLLNKEFNSILDCSATFWNIQHSSTTAYHPTSNGLVERLHWCLKDASRAHAASPDWVTHLYWCGSASIPLPVEDSTVIPLLQKLCMVHLWL